MKSMDDNVREFGHKLNEMIRGRHLTRDEARQMFSEVLMDQQSEMHQGAFLAAITANVATPEEIAGSWEAIYDLDTVKVRPNVEGPLVENCGTGMDTMETFNISTAASIVAAAEGVVMAKHASRAITSRCGAIDMVEALGVDVESGADVVKCSIEQAGIGIFNGMSPKIHPQGLGRILSKICFGTILNLSGSLASPVLPRLAVRGVHSQELVEPMAETLKEIGLTRAMVVHGLSNDGGLGMDEISPFNRTYVSELLEDGRIISYSLWPEDFGIDRYDDIGLGPKRDCVSEAPEFIDLISGDEGGIREDIVCMNAAPILYVTGRASGMMEGFKMARSSIHDGKAYSKLEDWVTHQSVDPTTSLDHLHSISR